MTNSKWQITTLVLVAGVGLAAASSAAQLLRCESIGGRRQACATFTGNGVALARQLGGSACALGKSWGWDASGVWVDKNCRGEFRVAYDPDVPEVRVTCDSDHNQVERCPADTRGGVLLVPEESSDNCRQGETWGWDLGSVWVSKRCTASFSISTVELGRAIRCAAFGNQTALCPVDVSGGVTLLVTNGGTQCVYGENWGLAERGVWVNPTCDATFRVDGRLRNSEDWSHPASLACESFGEARDFCPADTSRGVRVEREASDNVCVRNRTWGSDVHGIWVDGGCQALFHLGR